IGELDLSTAAPFVLRTRNNKRAVVKQDFLRDIGLRRLADASKDEIDFALTQFPDLLRDHRNLCDVYGDPRISSAEPLVHCRTQAGVNGLIPPDLDFPDGRIGKIFKLLKPLPQIVEYRRAAVEKRASILGELDTPAAAIQEALSDRMLQIGD